MNECPECGSSLQKRYTGEEITTYGGAYPYYWHCANCHWRSKVAVDYAGFGEEAQAIYRAVAAQFPKYKAYLDHDQP